MKNYMKIISTIFIVLMIVIISTQVYAETCPLCGGYYSQCPRCGGSGEVTGSTHTTDDIIGGAEGFIQTGEANANDKIGEDDLKVLSNTIYNILLVVGIVAAVIVGLIMGIKFMLGSLEEKAEIKTMIIPYIIGCIVVFGAFAIWKIVVDILQSV